MSGSDADIPNDDLGRPEPQAESDDTALQETIDFYKGKRGESAITLAVAGKAGVGKSTLVNKFLNLPREKAATAKKSAKSVTKEAVCYKSEVNGVSVRVVDTPGLGADTREEERKMIAKLSAFSDDGGPADLLIYCVSLRDRFTKSDGDTIRVLTRSFGKEIWKHAVFILTNADAQNDDDDEPASLKNLIKEFTVEFQATLRKVSVGEEEVPEVASIYSFLEDNDDPSLEAISNLEAKKNFKGIIGLPVSKDPNVPKEWQNALFIESIRKCRFNAIPAFLQLQGCFVAARQSMKESGKRKELAIKTTAGGAIGVGSGTLIGAGGGALVGAGIGAACGAGLASIPCAAVGAGTGAWIGALIGGGSIVPLGVGGGFAGVALTDGVLSVLWDQIQARKELHKIKKEKAKEKKGA